MHHTNSSIDKSLDKNYFKEASIQGKLKKLEEWLPNLLRHCISLDWKQPERKRKNLIQLGIDQEMADAWSRKRMGNGQWFHFILLIKELSVLSSQYGEL